MTIAVQLSESHFRHFLIFTILKRRKLYKSPVIFASILTFSAIICFLMHSVERGSTVGLCTACSRSEIGVPIAYFSNFFTSLKKQVKQQNLDPPRLVYTVQFSEDSDEFGVSNDNEIATYRWQDVYHAYFTKPIASIFS